MSNKKQHGGKRAGAGRKPKGKTAKKTYSFALDPELIARVDKLANSQSKSRSESVTAALNDWIAKYTEVTATGLTRAENEVALADLEALQRFEPKEAKNKPARQRPGDNLKTESKSPSKPKDKPRLPVSLDVNSSYPKQHKDFKEIVDEAANAIFKAKYGDMPTNNLHTMEPAKTAFEKYPELFSRDKKAPVEKRGLRHPKEAPMMGNVIALGLVPADLPAMAAMSLQERRLMQWELACKYRGKDV